jgi:hypothetical protein
MSGTLEPMDRDARLAQEAVQALPEPRASAAFRARLREEFMAGAIQPKGAESRGRIVRGPWLDRVSRPALAWAAVAAVVLVTVGIRVGGSRPRWELAAVTGDGIAIVDRVPVPLGHRDQLEALLRPGVTIELPPTAQIEIMAAGTLAIQITP